MNIINYTPLTTHNNGEHVNVQNQLLDSSTNTSSTHSSQHGDEDESFHVNVKGNLNISHARIPIVSLLC